MADEDIDSLLEQGIKAAADVENGVQHEKSDRVKRQRQSRSKSNSRSASPSHSRSRSRSRSTKHRRDRDRRRYSRSPSRSRQRRRSSRRSRSRSSRRRLRRDKDRSRHSRSRSRSSRRKRRDDKRSKSKSPEQPRARSTSAERAERAKQRELMELTRDHRTVFVGQLTQKVRERELEKFIGKFGKIEHIQLIRDKKTNRSKGFAYVEMSNLEDVPKILILNGQIPDFQVFPIMIKASEAEKNFAAKKDSAMVGTGTKASGGALSGASLSAASRIYCGNLHTNISEEDLRIVFQSFGEVLSVNINRDEMGRSKGFGFIQFASPQEANFALSKGNGLELAGNYLKLGPVSENGVGSSAGSLDSFSGGGAWKLDDDEGSGLTLNSQSRTALMAKLAGGRDMGFPGTSNMGVASSFAAASIASAAASAQRAERAAALASEEIEGSESFCFVIKNMFDILAEKKSGVADWHVEIKEDVEEECSNYGKVLHSYVEKEKQGGLVYILFERKHAAVGAARRLHGRWFNKRQISIRYMSSQEYVGMFPEARPAVQIARANASP